MNRRGPFRGKMDLRETRSLILLITDLLKAQETPGGGLSIPECRVISSMNGPFLEKLL